MKIRLCRVSVLALLGMSAIALAQDPQAPPPQAQDLLAQVPDPYTQPEPAKLARLAVHNLMAMHLVDAIKLATGMKEWNGLRMNDRIDALQYLTKMSYEYFMVPGSHEGTKARASILDNEDDFKSLTISMETAATGLSLADRMHDKNAAFAAMGKLIQSCNACHSKYMEPALLLPLPPAK